MTTTQPTRIDYTQGPARISTAPGSQGHFPPVEQLPEAAREPLEKLHDLYERRASASEALREAHAAVKQAKLDDASRLLEHVRAGGKAAEFKPAIDEAMRNLGHAEADLDMLSRLANEQYPKTARAVQALHDEGAATAAAAAEQASARYTEAIGELVAARQDYINATGLILFWRWLYEKGDAVVPGGDQIITPRGPITRIDQSTIQCLRLDAQTHERALDADL